MAAVADVLGIGAVGRTRQAVVIPDLVAVMRRIVIKIGQIGIGPAIFMAVKTGTGGIHYMIACRPVCRAADQAAVCRGVDMAVETVGVMNNIDHVAGMTVRRTA